MTDLEFELIKMMTRQDPFFEGKDLSISAQSELMGQHLLYASLFRKVESAISSGNTIIRQDETFVRLESEIKKYYEVRNFKSLRILMDAQTPKVRVLSAFPIIKQEDIDLISAILDSVQLQGDIHELTRFRSLLIYGIRNEVVFRSGNIGRDLPSFVNAALSSFDTKYVSLREIFLESDNTNTKLSTRSASFRSSMVEAVAKFDMFDDEFSKKTDSLHENLVRLETVHKENEKKYNELTANVDSYAVDLEEAVLKSKSSIEDYEKSVTEYLKTSILGKFWLKRARWATASLLFSIVIICTLFGGATWAVFHFSDDIKALITLKDLTPVEINILKDNVSGVVAFQLTRAFLIAVPIILYFWVIKLAVRFFMRSLLLMDDARQRNTIMQSYVQMVRDGAVDEKVLAIIMWALCRSVPGHGPDGIEPPDFTEVLRAGSSLGKNQA